VDQSGIIYLVLFRLYVNDMPMPFRHVELALCTDDTAIIATSRQPTLLVNYQETYISDIGWWLGECRIACISKSTVMLFTKASRHISTF
jgi:hypothetical protein